MRSRSPSASRRSTSEPTNRSATHSIAVRWPGGLAAAPLALPRPVPAGADARDLGVRRRLDRRRRRRDDGRVRPSADHGCAAGPDHDRPAARRGGSHPERDRAHDAARAAADERTTRAALGRRRRGRGPAGRRAGRPGRGGGAAVPARHHPRARGDAARAGADGHPDRRARRADADRPREPRALLSAGDRHRHLRRHDGGGGENHLQGRLRRLHRHRRRRHDRRQSARGRGDRRQTDARCCAARRRSTAAPADSPTSAAAD